MTWLRDNNTHLNKSATVNRQIEPVVSRKIPNTKLREEYMSKATDLIEYKNGVDYFVDKEERVIIGVRCNMCDLMINNRDKEQFMSIQVDGAGFSVTHKELVSLITATGLYDEITDMIEQGLIK